MSIRFLSSLHHVSCVPHTNTIVQTIDMIDFVYVLHTLCWKYALEPTGFDPLVGSDGFDPLWCKSPNGPQML
jgi:hypothetical protein